MPSNALTLKIFAPLLVLTGVLGFVLPENPVLMSGAAPYNWFHIAFGLLGIVLAFKGGERPSRWFNLGFGAADLYQIAAHAFAWFPAAHFRWHRADDIVHLSVGLALIAIGARARQPAGFKTDG